MPRVICTRPNASELINGVKFTPLEDGSGVISEDIGDDQAAAFTEIPGYQLAEGEEPAPAATPKADKVAKVVKAAKVAKVAKVKQEPEAPAADASEPATAASKEAPAADASGPATAASKEVPAADAATAEVPPAGEDETTF